MGNEQLRKAILSEVIVPKRVPDIVDVLKPQGNEDLQVRSEIWHLIEFKDVVLLEDRRV